MKSKRPDSNCKIDKRILLRIYKAFQREPLKVFVMKDFFEAYRKPVRDKYFGTLIRLGLIEEVPTVYFYGTNGKTRREVRGYRFLK